MGLSDLTPDDDDNGNGGGTKRKYVKITEDEMHEFFDERDENWILSDHPSGELVFATSDFAPIEDDLCLLVFSTIDKNSGVNRDKGADAIRVVAWYIPDSLPISGRKKTLRIKTWKKNLSQKIDSMMDEGDDVGKMCDECGSYMVKRDGQYGEFWGCASYPDCENTKQIED